MLTPSIFDERAASLSRVPSHSGQVVKTTASLHERADVRLHRLDVLGQERLLDLRDQPRVGQVDAVDLDLRRLLVEQVVELALVELLDRLVRVEEAAAAEDPAVPALHAVAGNRERALVERLAVVVERGQVEVETEPRPSQRGHMPPMRLKLALLVMVLSPRSTVIPPRPVRGRDVEGVRAGRADVRLASRLNRMRSIASASVAVPTVERGLDPIRSWSTLIAVVIPSSTSTSGRASVGMKPCTNVL